MIYLVRHCRATGQEPDAPLTKEGEQQAKNLAAFFHKKEVSHIVSSPYTRATATIAPFSAASGVPVQTDERLRERVLSEEPMDEWLSPLERSFQDPDYTCVGGESARDALTRGRAVLDSLPKYTVVVSHGNLLALLLGFGFDEWKQMKNPDVFVLDAGRVERVIPF
ncbi:phosphoglycerate mutase family 2 [Geomicrobium sp. JCM 19037]|uniref:histidine phosphatase family protein n=1 Tax=Geomicrobium sp. JCM 19037 TaxID=1460634 RepID=UPI00045F2F20|nr:histidine phosphatase family protein [Geomicrobium sp. JCM 19037]GAK05815.1 phosphoglycerate mutase family 2 [Geomicrobium sp. JCM 19037]